MGTKNKCKMLSSCIQIPNCISNVRCACGFLHANMHGIVCMCCVCAMYLLLPLQCCHLGMWPLSNKIHFEQCSKYVFPEPRIRLCHTRAWTGVLCSFSFCCLCSLCLMPWPIAVVWLCKIPC